MQDLRWFLLTFLVLGHSSNGRPKVFPLIPIIQYGHIRPLHSLEVTALLFSWES